MNKKYYIIVIFLVLTISMSGCGGVGIVTPDINDIVGDAYLCENLLKGFYNALSNQNFSQALTYCKSGGATFKLVNSRWDLALQYPTFYTNYQVYDVFDFKYVGQYLHLLHDFSYTIHSIYGDTFLVPQTTYYNNSLMLFEKVNGEWKMS